MSVDRQSRNNENLSSISDDVQSLQILDHRNSNSIKFERQKRVHIPIFPIRKKSWSNRQYHRRFTFFPPLPRYPRGRQLARGRPEKFSAVDMIPSSFPARVSITDSAKLTDGGGLFRPLKLIGESALSILRTWPPLPLGRRFRMLMQFRRLGST